MNRLATTISIDVERLRVHRQVIDEIHRRVEPDELELVERERSGEAEQRARVPCPTAPITSPCTKKMRRIDAAVIPIAFRMPISRVLSRTTIVSVLMMLNAATTTMSSRITPIPSFSSLSA